MALDHLFAHLDPDEREAALSILRVQVARRRRRAAEAARARPIRPLRPIVVPAEKRCPRCQQIRPATEWGLNRARPDGLQTYCKICRDA